MTLAWGWCRFSSVPFDLDNIHTPKSRDVHLCNNSIQKLSTDRPTDEWAPECMWHSDRFIAYLNEQASR